MMETLMIEIPRFWNPAWIPPEVDDEVDGEPCSREVSVILNSGAQVKRRWWPERLYPNRPLGSWGGGDCHADRAIDVVLWRQDADERCHTDKCIEDRMGREMDRTRRDFGTLMVDWIRPPKDRT